jgi:hypothetical protein
MLQSTGQGRRRTLLAVQAAAWLLFGLALPALVEFIFTMIFSLLDLFGAGGIKPEGRVGFHGWPSISYWVARRGTSILALLAFLWIKSDIHAIVISTRRRQPQ